MMYIRIVFIVLALMLPINAIAHEIGHHAEFERPGLVEIVGGIGWIVGILGFIAYLKSRRKN
jgi:hypothetical protein